MNRARARGLTGRSALARMTAAYETHRVPAGLPATWQVVYAVAWVNEAPATQMPRIAAETHIDLAQMRAGLDATLSAPETLLARSLFVAGTDTGVGKTWVSTVLIRALVEAGLRVTGMKPVAAGAEQMPYGLSNDDAVALARRGTSCFPTN